MRKLYLVFCMIFALNGCIPSSDNSANNTNISPIKPILIGSPDADDGPDFTLSINETQSTDSSAIYKIISLYKGKQVGFLLEVPNKSSKDGFGKGLIIKSIGEPSVNFLNFLSDLAKMKNDSSRRFSDLISVPFVDLGKFAVDKFGKEPDNESSLEDYKLFLDDQDGLELYINVSVKGKYVEIEQKESGSWPLIINFFTKK